MHPRPTLHQLRETHGPPGGGPRHRHGGWAVVDLEFKAGATPGSRDERHLRWLRDQLGDGFLAGAVLHSGTGLYELGDRAFAVLLCALWG